MKERFIELLKEAESRWHKSRTAKKAAAAVLAASVGATSVLGHEKEHIERIQGQPDTAYAHLTEDAAPFSDVVSTVMITRGTFCGRI